MKITLPNGSPAEAPTEWTVANVEFEPMPIPLASERFLDMMFRVEPEDAIGNAVRSEIEAEKTR